MAVNGERSGGATIGTSSGLLIQGPGPNSFRSLLTIINTSTGSETITLGFGQDAVLNNGVVLYPGDDWVESLDARFEPFNGDIFAIASAGTATVGYHYRTVGE